MAVNIILDGCGCPKCKDFHPTVFWHKKYDEYELNRYRGSFCRWQMVLFIRMTELQH